MYIVIKWYFFRLSSDHIIDQTNLSIRHKPSECKFCIHTQNHIHLGRTGFRYLKLMSPLNVAICTTISYTLWVEWYYLKTIIWPWGQRSRSPEGHYGTQHTALWSCTHIPNIIDLSRKTKKIFPGQNTI
jgi:hypothetical protein